MEIIDVDADESDWLPEPGKEKEEAQDRMTKDLRSGSTSHRASTPQLNGFTTPRESRKRGRRGDQERHTFGARGKRPSPSPTSSNGETPPPNLGPRTIDSFFQSKSPALSPAEEKQRLVEKLPKWGALVQSPCATRSFEKSLEPVRYRRAFHLNYRSSLGGFNRRPPGVGTYAKWWRGSRSRLFGGGENPLIAPRVLDNGEQQSNGGQGFQWENDCHNFKLMADFCLVNGETFFVDRRHKELVQFLRWQASDEELRLCLFLYHQARIWSRWKKDHGDAGLLSPSMVEDSISPPLLKRLGSGRKHKEEINMSHIENLSAINIIKVLAPEEIECVPSEELMKILSKRECLTLERSIVLSKVSKKEPKVQTEYNEAWLDKNRKKSSFAKVLSRMLCIESLTVTLGDEAFLALYYCHVAFLTVCGYEPEDAIALLLSDIPGLSFASGAYFPQKGAGGAMEVEDERGTDALVQSLFQSVFEFESYLDALNVSDTFEAAVEVGNEAIAYECFHKASNILLMFSSSSSPASFSSDTPVDSSAGSEKENKEDVHFLLTPFGRTCTVLERVIFCGISLLEREKKYSEAIHYIQLVLSASHPVIFKAQRGLLWFRLSMDYYHLGSASKALEACELGLEDLHVGGGDRLQLEDRCMRLSSPPLRWKKPSFPTRITAEIRTLKEEEVATQPCQATEVGATTENGGPLGDGVTGGSIEDKVKRWYLNYLCRRDDLENGIVALDCAPSAQWTGMHAENGIFLTLFSLLCWEVIFPTPPDGERKEDLGIQLPYQDCPLDFFSFTFFRRRHRKALLEVELERIKEGYAEILKAMWQRHCPSVCVGCDWSRNSLEELLRIANGLGGLVLAEVCRTLAENYPEYSHGFPDLILWTQTGEPKVLLVEVKGPGDRLSYAQHHWIHRLRGAGASVEVCYVLRDKSSPSSSPPVGEQSPPIEP